jgi:hypothetical protein
MKLDGRVRDARTMLFADIGKQTALVKDPLDDAKIAGWRAVVERLASEFRAGRAGVDPLKGSKTCANCGLQAVCRVTERRDAAELIEDEELDEEASDG